jgi:uncharacterized protein (DUF305 family)
VRRDQRETRRTTEVESDPTYFRGNSPEMKAMATQIIAAQNAEIAQFDAWLARKK